jgi:hypothetical protein
VEADTSTLQRTRTHSENAYFVGDGGHTPKDVGDNNQTLSKFDAIDEILGDVDFIEDF